MQKRMTIKGSRDDLEALKEFLNEELEALPEKQNIEISDPMRIEQEFGKNIPLHQTELLELFIAIFGNVAAAGIYDIVKDKVLDFKKKRDADLEIIEKDEKKKK